VDADSALWWAVWWPWTLVWGSTLVALVIACWCVIAQWRTRSQPPFPHGSQGISLYLHDGSVMDLYLQGGYKTALRHEVEERITSGKDKVVQVAFPHMGARAGQTVDREVFRRYIEVAQPITVIQIIMEVLQKADNIVYIDLIDRVIAPDKALNRAMQAIHHRNRPPSGLVHLQDLERIDAYVSVRGRFRHDSETPDTVTFSTQVENTADADPMVRVTCINAGLRRTAPQTTFHARCLGRVQGWDNNTRTLIIAPIAIFQ
jgi:hypothetical protein